MSAALPYNEPTIVTILIDTSFLLLLNLVNAVLDKFVFCGLVGQVFLGTFWGTPLGGWLNSGIEQAVVQLGYLGLILIVYEGGLHTAINPLLTNLTLSSAVAATGIILPIAFSFCLEKLVEATPLQCFAAGAALSATSLGTTFTILSTAGFAKTRLGVVLTSAAMMDDVIGLVMIQIVSSLGGPGGVDGASIGRPIGASVGLLVAVIIGSWAWGKLVGQIAVPEILSRLEAQCFVQTGLLISLVVAADYAGASPLFAAFLAGSIVSWQGTLSTVDATVHMTSRETSNAQGVSQSRQSRANAASQIISTPKSVEVYEHFYATVVGRILKPFFFASIGFSIPITQMFYGPTVWRGIVFALLMMLGKLLTGIWLIRFSIQTHTWMTIPRNISGFLTLKLKDLSHLLSGHNPKRNKSRPPNNEQSPPADQLELRPHQQHTPHPSQNESNPRDIHHPAPRPARPVSLYPSAILGLAMVARGEVAFLIASVAQSKGIFDPAPELYMIVMWAAVLCTVIGPVGVGLLVRRVKALEEKRRAAGGGAAERVLGVWGVA